MKRRLLQDAIRIAYEKHERHPMFGVGFTLSSFTVMDNKILGMGMNNTSYIVPAHYGYNKRQKGYGHFIPCIHSEIDAYRKTKGLICGENFEMINIRIRDSKTLGMSCPCSCCTHWLSQNNCKHVYFTNPSGMWAKISF